MSATPPPLLPPVIPDSSTGPGATKKAGQALGILATVGILAAKFGKVALASLKVFKGVGILKTGLSMLIYAGVYALRFGWMFAVGLTGSIFVHEMGHVAAAAMCGIAVSAPVFIPFVGALIVQKQAAGSNLKEAVIGIGGPIAGTLAGVACHAVFFVTGEPFWLVLAHFTYFVNLFNLTPVYPLDGGWILGAVSPYLWIAGIVILAGLFIAGILTNLFILIIILMSLPSLIHGLKTGTMHKGSSIPCTPTQKWAIGIGYLALVGFLAGAMVVTDTQLAPFHGQG